MKKTTSRKILILSILIGLALAPVGAGAQNWKIETVNSDGNVGEYTSIALDPSGYPHISYYDNTNAGLKYAKLTGSGWIKQTVDKDNAGEYNSLALDSSGNPHISYTMYRGLKYAKWTGSAWDIQTVDSTGLAYYTSIALDKNGNPHISYYDWDNRILKYAKWTGSGWSLEIVDFNGDLGSYSSLALDKYGNPHISYYDATNGDLKYAYIPASSQGSASSQTTSTPKGTVTSTATTPKGAAGSPTATTLAATDITSTSATLKGSVNPNGLDTIVDFASGIAIGLWADSSGKIDKTGAKTDWGKSPVQNLKGNSAVEVTYTLTGLTPGTKYSYAVRAKNSAGAQNGELLTFTTLPGGAAPSTQQNMADVTFAIDSRSVVQNEDVLVPVTIKSSKNVGNADLLLKYDSSVIKATDVISGSIVNDAQFAANFQTPGEIRISFANSNGVSGEGSLAFLKLQAVGNTGTKSTVKFNDASVNEAGTMAKLRVSIVQGEVSVIASSAVLKGDVNGDGRISSADALMALKMSVKAIPDKAAADMNSDGQITSADAAMILKAAI